MDEHVVDQLYTHMDGLGAYPKFSADLDKPPEQYLPHFGSDLDIGGSLEPPTEPLLEAPIQLGNMLTDIIKIMIQVNIAVRRSVTREFACPGHAPQLE